MLWWPNARVTQAPARSGLVRLSLYCFIYSPASSVMGHDLCHLPECQGCGKMANRKRSLDKDNWELASHRIFANLRLCSMTSWWLWFWRWTAHFAVYPLDRWHTLLCTCWMDSTLFCAPAGWTAHFAVHPLDGWHTLLCTCWMDGTLCCAHTEWTIHFAVHLLDGWHTLLCTHWMDGTLCCALLDGQYTLLCTCWVDRTLCCAHTEWMTHFAVHPLTHHSIPADIAYKAWLRLQTAAYHEWHIPGFLLL